MANRTLITLDLSITNIPDSSEKRADFYEKLKELHWVKIRGVTTGWKISWEEGSGVTASIVASTIKSDLKAAATAAEVSMSSVTAIWQTGPWDLERV